MANLVSPEQSTGSPELSTHPYFNQYLLMLIRFYTEKALLVQTTRPLSPSGPLFWTGMLSAVSLFLVLAHISRAGPRGGVYGGGGGGALQAKYLTPATQAVSGVGGGG